MERKEREAEFIEDSPSAAGQREKESAVRSGTREFGTPGQAPHSARKMPRHSGSGSRRRSHEAVCTDEKEQGRGDQVEGRNGLCSSAAQAPETGRVSEAVFPASAKLPDGPEAGGAPGCRPAILTDVPLSDVHDGDDTYQFRFNSDSKAITAALAQSGQLNPIKVMAGKDSYVVLDGFRRVRAARKLGWQSVRALIYPWMPPEQARKVAFVSNVVRQNLSIAEKANAMHLARKEGYSMRSVAEMFDMSCRQVERYLKLPNQLLELIDGKDLTMAHGAILKNVARMLSGSELKDLVTRIRAGRLGVKETRNLLKTSGMLEKRGRTKSRFGTIQDERVRVYAFKLGSNSSAEELDAAALFLREAAARIEALSAAGRSRTRNERPQLEE